MPSELAGWVLLAVLLGLSAASPLGYLEVEGRPLAVVSELGRRALGRPQDGTGPLAPALDARLPLPSPQDLDAIKKVAQILVMLGEQVIPSIIGELALPAPAPAPHAAACESAALAEDPPNDPVSDN